MQARRYSTSPVDIPLFNRAQGFTDRIAIATPEGKQVAVGTSIKFLDCATLTCSPSGEHTYRQLLFNARALSRDLVDCATDDAVHKRDFPVAFLTPRDYSYAATMYAVWQAGM